MSATQSTVNYHFPIFVGTDVPSWLVDWNNAMTALDEAIANAMTIAQTGEADVTALEGRVQTISDTVTEIAEEVSGHDASIGELNTAMAGLETLVGTLATQVGELKTLVENAVGRVGVRHNGNIGVGETTLTISAPELTATSIVDVYFDDEPLLVPDNIVTDVANKLVRVFVPQRLTTLKVSVLVRE